MSQEAHAHRRQEERIKNHLYNLEFEECQTTTQYNFKDFYQLHRQLSKKNTDYPELSDWSSNF